MLLHNIKTKLQYFSVALNNMYYSEFTGFSDPYVEILLMPEERFKIKPVKTDYKKKELNPFFAKDFKVYVFMVPYNS